MERIDRADPLDFLADSEVAGVGETIDAVVFDLAGTTVKDIPKTNDVSANAGHVNDAIRETLWEKSRVEVSPQEVAAVMGEAKPVAFRKLLLAHLSPDLAHTATDEQVNALNESFESDRMIPFYLHDPSVGEIEDTTPCFEALKQARKKRALNTGFSRRISDAILKRLHWQEKGLIDLLVASDEVPKGRPYPDMIRLIRKKLGLAPWQKIAKVGDTTVDIMEGINAECTLILAVLTGTGKKEQLETFGADQIAKAEANGSPLQSTIVVVQNIREATDRVLSFRTSSR